MHLINAERVRRVFDLRGRSLKLGSVPAGVLLTTYRGENLQSL
jgi:hypothetical protein